MASGGSHVPGQPRTLPISLKAFVVVEQLQVADTAEVDFEQLLSRAHVPRSESPALVDALAIVFKYGKHPFAIRTDDYLHHWLGNFD